MVRSRATWLGLLAVVTLGGLVYLFLDVTADPVSSAASAAATGDEPPARIGATEAAQPEPGGKPARKVTPFRPTMSSGPAEPEVTDTRRDEDPPALAEDTGDKQELGKLDEEMALASKYYDGNDYEAAQKQALRVLAKEPENIRMLRVVVSSACMMGDADTATKYFPSLPAGRDQRDMVKRCSRYEITLPEPKQVYPKGGSRGPRGGGDTPIR
jgi:hypothetical protein